MKRRLLAAVVLWASVLGACGTAVWHCGSAAAQAQIGYNPTGPNAADYGAGPAGFPRADRTNWYLQPFFVDAHSRFDEILPSRIVGRAETPRALGRPPSPPMAYRFRGEARTVEDYLASNPVTGLLVMKGDQILLEHYQYNRRDTHRMTSWSMAKTIVSLMVGIAMEEGAIRSLDDTPEDYAPGLAGSEYGRTPLRHLLTMSSGVRFREDYDPHDDVAKLFRTTFAGPGALSSLIGFNDRAAEPGVRFYYASSETAVLGLTLAAAVKLPLTDYLAEKIWKPMGAEADAAWLIDTTGAEATFCCFNAILRDYARLGLMMAEGGRVGPRQVVPAEWLKQMASVHATHLAPGGATRFWGYGYQTWIFPRGGGDFALLGVRGQTIFVDPVSKLVLVNTAIRPNARDTGVAETVALWQGLKENLAR